MRKLPSLLVLALVVLAGCSRDPNVVKKRYLEQGNKYFEKGRYKEASIMYRNALQKDQKYGIAHYQLALSELKLQKYPSAAGALRRALELLPPSSPEYREASVKLAEMYLSATREKQFLDEVENIANTLLKYDANSFEGHRLMGDFHFASAQELSRVGSADRAREGFAQADAEYRKAERSKPGQIGIQLAMARVAGAQGKLDEAETAYAGVVQRQKDAVGAWTELYRLYMLRDQPARAEAALKSAIEANPKQYDLPTMLASHYYGQKQRGEMIKVLDNMRSQAKENAQAYLMVGDFYLRLGEADEAVRQYEAGIQNDARQKTAYLKRIVEVRMRQGRTDQALQAGDQILKDNPKDSDIRALKATLLLDKGDAQKAIAELRQVVTGSPDNFIARYHLGRAHQAKGELEQARHQYNEAIRVKPDYMPARAALAQLQLLRNEYEGALKTAAEMLEADRQNVAARLIQASAYRGQNKWSEARATLNSVLSRSPDLGEAVFQLAMLDMQEGKFAQAEDNFRKVAKLEPNATRGILGIAELYMTQKHYEKAISYVQEEMKTAGNKPELRQAIGNAAVRAGKFDLAVAEFRQSLSGLNPKSQAAARAAMLLGETYRVKGDFESAIGTLRQARENAPEDAMILHTLALSYEGSGRKQEARRAYEELIKLDPNNPVALNNLAYAIAESGGDLNQALTLAQRAKQKFPQLVEISDTLGWIYLKKNMSDNALDIFRDLVTKQPTRSTYRYHLAMALMMKGERVQAKRELETALQHNPPQEEAGKIRDLMTKL